MRVRNGSTVGGTLLQAFVHDPVAEKIVIKKTYNSTGSVIETVYYFDEDYVKTDYHNGTVVNCEYVYLEGQQVAQSCTGETTKWIHGDHLGSASVVTNSNGDPIENTTYEPFGSIVEGGEETRFDYTGKEYDEITNSYDFNKRTYNPEFAQFQQADPMIQNLYDPQSLNHFAYVRNNPYLLIDPDGKNYRVYLNYNKPNLGPIKLGHIAIGVDDHISDNSQAIFENHGIGNNIKGEFLGMEVESSNEFHRQALMSTLQGGTYEAQTESYSIEIIDEAGNIVMPISTDPYDCYFEVEQSEYEDLAMIIKGEELTSKEWYYSTFGHNSLDFANEITSAGGKPLASTFPYTPNRVYKVSKKKYSGNSWTSFWKKAREWSAMIKKAFEEHDKKYSRTKNK